MGNFKIGWNHKSVCEHTVLKTLMRLTGKMKIWEKKVLPDTCPDNTVFTLKQTSRFFPTFFPFLLFEARDHQCFYFRKYWIEALKTVFYWYYYQSSKNILIFFQKICKNNNNTIFAEILKQMWFFRDKIIKQHLKRIFSILRKLNF